VVQQIVAGGILFHQAVADRLGLNASDLQCLNILFQMGPVTAGDVAARTGLTTGAITRLLDRLERAGYVRREHDPRDRRRVIVHPVLERMSELAPLYEGVARAWDEVLAAYSDEQLVLILDLLGRLRPISGQEAARLRRPVQDG